MADPITNNISPLSFEDLQKIESTNFSSLERHHLRLLAHCLFCFKEMNQDNINSLDLPKEEARLSWCLNQPTLSEDQAFISILLEQFSAAAQQLETIASFLEVPPLELTIEHLIIYRRKE